MATLDGARRIEGGEFVSVKLSEGETANRAETCINFTIMSQIGSLIGTLTNP